MRLFYCDEFVLPLPPAHRFPMSKYSLLRERLTTSGQFRVEEFCVPAPASDAQLGLAHVPDYLARVVAGQLTAAQVRAMGFPWSPQLVERSRRSVGSTIEAARWALAAGVAVNLAGGTHHAFADRGEGYCVFNDAVVAARTLQAEGLIRRVAIIDADVHQGNGTAKLVEADESIFSFSIHGQKNYPVRKEVSDLDVALPDGATDATYQAALEPAVHQAIDRGCPDLVIYLAGADPYHADRFGRLALTKAGLLARDEFVFDLCRQKGLPVAVAMAGGYAPQIEDIVDIHASTVLAARRLEGDPSPQVAQ